MAVYTITLKSGNSVTVELTHRTQEEVAREFLTNGFVAGNRLIAFREGGLGPGQLQYVFNGQLVIMANGVETIRPRDGDGLPVQGPIRGVETTTTGMVGQTERGPTRPRLVTSSLEFKRLYGDIIDPTISFLPFAVRGFFENGGRRLFIARITRNDAVAASLAQPTSGPNDVIFTADGPGAWGNNIFLRIQDGTRSSVTQPTLRVTLLYYSELPPLPLVDPLAPNSNDDANRREPTLVEEFDNLSSDADNFIDKINSISHLVNVAMSSNGSITRPNNLVFTQLAGGSNGVAALCAADYQGEPLAADPDNRTGLAGLATIDEIAILAVPDEHISTLPAPDRTQVTNAIVDQCELLRNRFAVLSADPTPADPGDFNPPRNSSFAALYHPWIRVLDARNRDTHLVPASGHVCGIYARIDTAHGVHKAPVDVVRGVVEGNRPTEEQLGFTLTRQQQDNLNRRGVDIIRPDGVGVRVWGARTMSSDPEWRYISVRRLSLYVEESINKGTQWVAFESNDEQTWSMVCHLVRNFLLQVWQSGALQGARERDAFFVRCDRSTMTQADIDAGRLICMIGIAPVRPAEFLIIRISHSTASD